MARRSLSGLRTFLVLRSSLRGRHLWPPGGRLRSLSGFELSPDFAPEARHFVQDSFAKPLFALSAARSMALLT